MGCNCGGSTQVGTGPRGDTSPLVGGPGATDSGFYSTKRDAGSESGKTPPERWDGPGGSKTNDAPDA